MSTMSLSYSDIVAQDGYPFQSEGRTPGDEDDSGSINNEGHSEALTNLYTLANWTCLVYPNVYNICIFVIVFYEYLARTCSEEQVSLDFRYSWTLQTH